jgi:tetratricopeptide (TPR) repeat protein
MSGVYKSIYPSLIQDQTLIGPVRECAIYTLANQREEKGAWRDAYDTYQVYYGTYPNGLFVSEAREHSAVVLVALAEDQATGKQYADAMAILNLVIAKHSETKVAAEVPDITRSLYESWVSDLRALGNFEKATQILTEYKSWVQNNNKTELESGIQLELADIYLEWGLSLQNQNQFDAARVKLDLAAATDPEPASPSGPAAKVKANEAKFQIEWGDYLLIQKDFTGAITRYKNAISLSEDQEKSNIQDSISKVYAQWALSLSEQEDFLGALRQLDEAQKIAVAESVKKLVDDTREEIYLAFSNSVGEQAQKAMKDASRFLCEEHGEPDLPIFGLDSTNVRAQVYGTDQELPENVNAKTPGEMHYVACITEDTKIVGRESHLLRDVHLYPNLPPVSFNLFFNRVQYFWIVSLREINTGKEYKTTTIDGGDPPPIDPNSLIEHMNSPYFFGTKPDIAGLASWLLPYLK